MSFDNPMLRGVGTAIGWLNPRFKVMGPNQAKQALDSDMTPIVCVGEGLEVRQAGNHVAHTLAGTTLAPRDRPTDAAPRRREEPYG